MINTWTETCQNENSFLQFPNPNHKNKLDILIYPNPVNNMLTIEGRVVKDIIIYSVLGKVVLKMSNQNSIDVSSLSKGVYFIKGSDGINSSTKKFIKN